MRLPHLLPAMLLAATTISCAGGAPEPAPSPAPPSPPPATVVVQKPLETVTVTIQADGFRLDSASAAAFKIGELRMYQGSRLTFVNQDNVPHDIQSDPPHIHTECPEIGGAGFLVPGQT